MTLRLNDPISAADVPISHALFVEEGVASVVKGDGSRATEICLIGAEGFCGVPLITGGGVWPYRTFVQAESLRGLQVEAGTLRQVLNADGELRQLLIKAVHATLIQVAEGLASNATLRLPERLARWLLMYRDRNGGERMAVTHSFMALMLGAQRTGITNALHGMEGAGLIVAERGVVSIRNLDGLRMLAGSGYGTAEAEQVRLADA